MMKSTWVKSLLAILVVFAGYKFWSGHKSPTLSSDRATSHFVTNKNRTPASQKATNTKPSSVSSELDKQLKEISKTKDCYTSQSCPFDQTDPRAYDFAVGEKLAAQLKEAHLKFKNDPSAKMALKNLGIDFFRSENGFVQEAALNILRDFPNDEEAFKALTEGLKESYNPLIVEMSLPELQKYLGTNQEDQVHDALSELMRGAHFASQAVAENILGFINPHSYDHYRNVLAQMNPQTQAYRDLKSALKEYEKRQSGG